MQHTGRQAGGQAHTRICQHPFRARKSKFALSLVLEILPQPATTDQSSCFHLVGAETEESRGGQKKERKKKIDRKKTAQPPKNLNMRRVQSVFKTGDILQFDFWHAQLLPFLAENWMRRLIPLCHLCEVARQPAEIEPGSVCACGRPLFSEKLSERVASLFVFLLFIHSFFGLFVRVRTKVLHGKKIPGCFFCFEVLYMHALRLGFSHIKVNCPQKMTQSDNLSIYYKDKVSWNDTFKCITF